MVCAIISIIIRWRVILLKVSFFNCSFGTICVPQPLSYVFFFFISCIADFLLSPFVHQQATTQRPQRAHFAFQTVEALSYPRQAILQELTKPSFLMTLLEAIKSKIKSKTCNTVNSQCPLISHVSLISFALIKSSHLLLLLPCSKDDNIPMLISSFSHHSQGVQWPWQQTPQKLSMTCI